MKKIIGLCLLILCCGVLAQQQGPGARVDGEGVPGNLVIFGEDGSIIDSGVSYTNIIANTNNGVAGLDSNGKISTNVIPDIIITFTGSQRL